MMIDIQKIVFFFSSRRHSNTKQWSFGKKRFNDNPKEVMMMIVVLIYSFDH